MGMYRMLAAQKLQPRD